MDLARLSNEWEASEGRLPERALTQAECDAIQAAARRSGPQPSALHIVEPQPALDPTEDPIDSRLAEEIEYAQQLLEAVGDRFIADPLILQRHQTTMQGFDIIGQILGHLAKVVGARDKAEAIDRIGMQELRARLKRPAGTSAARSGT